MTTDFLQLAYEATRKDYENYMDNLFINPLTDGVPIEDLFKEVESVSFNTDSKVINIGLGNYMNIRFILCYSYNKDPFGTRNADLVLIYKIDSENYRLTKFKETAQNDGLRYFTNYSSLLSKKFYIDKIVVNVEETLNNNSLIIYTK